MRVTYYLNNCEISKDELNRMFGAEVVAQAFKDAFAFMERTNNMNVFVPTVYGQLCISFSYS